MTIDTHRQHALRERLYTAVELQPLISPRSIAIVGASASGRGFGASAQRQLLAADIRRPLYLVHPRFASEAAPDGCIGVASVRALPRGVDCLLVAVPADAVEPALHEAADRECRSAIIFSAGFGEIEGGAAVESRLRDFAQSRGMRLGGPNTAGVINYRERLPLTFVPELRMELPSGNLAIVSQSAGLATHLGHRRNRGLGVSYTITTGNSVDVTAFDYANFLLDDAATDVVLLVIEGLENPAGLLELGRKSRACGKPVLALKTGRTRQGERAAVSHTGSLAGSYEVFQAAAEEAGIQLYRTAEELLETGQLFARWARKTYVRGGVGVLTTMGGPGVMAADAADDEGVILPAPTGKTVARLRELIPSFAAMGNPIDTTAAPTDPVLQSCLAALGQDEGFSAVVMLAASQTGPSTAQRPAAIVAAVRESEKPMAAVWLSSWLECPSSEVLDAEPTLPVFRSVDRCMRAVARWTAWHERQPEQSDDSVGPILSETQIAGLGHLAGSAQEGNVGPQALSEARSRDVLAALDVRVPIAAVVTNRDEAQTAAQCIGFPVVAKVLSADVPHKAAAGGVRLGLSSADAVGAAFDSILHDVSSYCPDATIDGVLVVEQVQGGTEFMCGLVRDRVFGPVVLVGAGGGEVEALNDVGRAIAPVTARAARRALLAVKAFQRYKKRQPERAEAFERQIVELMQRLGAAALACPWILEVDINPLVQPADGQLVALDALVVIEQSTEASRE